MERIAATVLVLTATIQILVTYWIPVEGYDGAFFLQWIAAFARLADLGCYYPRWLPDGFGGLGSPAFYFYPPLAYIFSGVLHLILPGLSAAGLFLTAGLTGTLLSVMGMYYFARRVGILPIPAILAGLLYGFAPFRFFDLYTRNGLGEHLGFAFLPFFFGGLYAVITYSRIRTVSFLMLSLGWTGILLSNIPLALVTSITGAMTILILSWNAWTRLAFCALAILTGTLLAAFYLLPVVPLEPYVQISKLWILNGGSRLPDYVHQLFTILHNLTMGAHSLLMDLALLILIVIALPWVRSENITWRRLARATAAIGLVTLLIQFPPIGDLLFYRVQVFELIQFVWRFYILILLLLALWYGLLQHSNGVAAVPSTRLLFQRRTLSAVTLCFSLITIVCCVIALADLRVHPRVPHWTPFDPPEYASIYASDDPNTVIRVAKEHAHDPFVQVGRTLDSNEVIRWRQGDPKHVSFAVTLTQPARIALHQFSWPLWRLVASGSAIPLGTDSLARATAILHAGEYTADLKLERSTEERIGNGISLTTLGLLIVGICFLELRRYRLRTNGP
jgi:hypothetical protein